MGYMGPGYELPNVSIPVLSRSTSGCRCIGNKAFSTENLKNYHAQAKVHTAQLLDIVDAISKGKKVFSLLHWISIGNVRLIHRIDARGVDSGSSDVMEDMAFSGGFETMLAGKDTECWTQVHHSSESQKGQLNGKATRPWSTSPQHVEADLIEICANLEEEQAVGERSYLDCFCNAKNKMALQTWTGILIQAWQQLTGINFIFYYGTTFLKNSDISSRNSLGLTLSANECTDFSNDHG
ncbi:hypothetical protein F5146DRAFT_996646 [Armillaria mellea]|nr:hypothetical protein F5146DRAFT_996646 [Armillaria mellea]